MAYTGVSPSAVGVRETKMALGRRSASARRDARGLAVYWRLPCAMTRSGLETVCEIGEVVEPVRAKSGSSCGRQAGRLDYRPRPDDVRGDPIDGEEEIAAPASEVHDVNWTSLRREQDGS